MRHVVDTSNQVDAKRCGSEDGSRIRRSFACHRHIHRLLLIEHELHRTTGAHKRLGDSYIKQRALCSIAHLVSRPVRHHESRDQVGWGQSRGSRPLATSSCLDLERGAPSLRRFAALLWGRSNRPMDNGRLIVSSTLIRSFDRARAVSSTTTNPSSWASSLRPVALVQRNGPQQDGVDGECARRRHQPARAHIQPGRPPIACFSPCRNAVLPLTQRVISIVLGLFFVDLVLGEYLCGNQFGLIIRAHFT